MSTVFYTETQAGRITEINLQQQGQEIITIVFPLRSFRDQGKMHLQRLTSSFTLVIQRTKSKDAPVKV